VARHETGVMFDICVMSMVLDMCTRYNL
jgi:hypothetical protein